MALARRLHRAITRPFHRPQVDHDAHREVEDRQRRIERRLRAQRRDLARIGLLGLQAEVRGRSDDGAE